MPGNAVAEQRVGLGDAHHVRPEALSRAWSARRPPARPTTCCRWRGRSTGSTAARTMAGDDLGVRPARSRAAAPRRSPDPAAACRAPCCRARCCRRHARCRAPPVPLPRSRPDASRPSAGLRRPSCSFPLVHVEAPICAWQASVGNQHEMPVTAPTGPHRASHVGRRPGRRPALSTREIEDVCAFLDTLVDADAGPRRDGRIRR